MGSFRLLKLPWLLSWEMTSPCVSSFCCVRFLLCLKRLTVLIGTLHHFSQTTEVHRWGTYNNVVNAVIHEDVCQGEDVPSQVNFILQVLVKFLQGKYKMRWLWACKCCQKWLEGSTALLTIMHKNRNKTWDAFNTDSLKAWFKQSTLYDTLTHENWFTNSIEGSPTYKSNGNIKIPLFHLLCFKRLQKLEV